MYLAAITHVACTLGSCPAPPLLTGLMEDVGSGTYTGLCALALDSFFKSLPPSCKNLDFLHPILQQKKGCPVCAKLHSGQSPRGALQTQLDRSHWLSLPQQPPSRTWAPLDLAPPVSVVLAQDPRTVVVQGPANGEFILCML
jgi:hypothetical protein